MKDKEINSEIISEKITKGKNFDPQNTEVEITASQIVESAHKFAMTKIGKLSRLTIKGSFGNTALDAATNVAYIPAGGETNIEFVYLVSKNTVTSMISNAFKKFKTDGVFSRYLQAFTGDEKNDKLGPDALLIGAYSSGNNIYYVCPYRWSLGNTRVSTNGLNGSIKANIDKATIPANNTQQNTQQNGQQNNQQSGQQNTSGQSSSGPSGVSGLVPASIDPKIKFNKPIVNEADRIYLEKMIFEKIINNEKNK